MDFGVALMALKKGIFFVTNDHISLWFWSAAPPKIKACPEKSVCPWQTEALIKITCKVCHYLAAPLGVIMRNSKGVL